MNCPNCGTSNLDNAPICANCGRALMQSQYAPPPPAPSYGASSNPAGMNIPNYLWQSIVITLCCCLPLGVVAIIFSAQVNSKLAQGDVSGAMEASRKAKMFCLIGLALGLVAIVLSLLLNGAAFMAALSEAGNQ